MASYLINNVGINTTTRVEADSLSIEGIVVKFLASQRSSRRARSPARRPCTRRKPRAAQARAPLDGLSN
jgi:hypothetical protein